MKRARGFTVVEVVFAIALGVVLALMVISVYVAAHFIAKYW